MARQRLHAVRIIVILVAGILLIGQDCPAQTGLCDPDPCQGIANAVAGTCAEIGGSCTGPSDFTCDCVTGSTWLDTANTCLGPTAQIPTGCFDMGDHFDPEGGIDELPVHNVCISAFWMDLHEVTNAEYAECVGAGACTLPEYLSSFTRPTYHGNPAYDDFPVIHVNWHQAKDYCTWAGKRLPTEAEWEYAARGGLAGKRYPWGDTIDCDDACYDRSYSSHYCWDHCHNGMCDNDTHPVESYAPNDYGLYAMAGNVMEWVNDWYQQDYYSVSPTNDPPGPASGYYPAMRGGAWYYMWYSARVAFRSELPIPDIGDFSIGFRCARGGAFGP